MEKRGLIFTLFLVVFLLSITRCTKSEKNLGPVVDIEGNSYKTVKIGDQVWMAENLKTTLLNDGTVIALTQDSLAWSNLASPGYCWYNNDRSAYMDPYGALYNGLTISTGKLCPDGWHIPEKAEWIQLRDFVGDSLTAGGKIKEADMNHWLSPNKGADNSSGFTALGAGFRYFEGTYSSMLSFTSFWSATMESTDDEWYTGLYSGEASFILDHRNQKYGFSVRCLKD